MNKKNDENVYSVGKRAFFTLSRTLYTISSKYIYFFIHVDQKYSIKQFEIFPKACTRILNNINFRQQGLQIGAFQQRYLRCKCETPYFEGELVPKTCKS